MMPAHMISIRFNPHKKEVTAVFTLENYMTAFIGSLVAHAALTVYLFVIMEVRGWRILKKLPAMGEQGIDCRLDFVGNLNELEKELGERFVRIHRAYLAARDRIEALDSKKNTVRVGEEHVCCPGAEKQNCGAGKALKGKSPSRFYHSGTICAVQENLPVPDHRSDP